MTFLNASCPKWPKRWCHVSGELSVLGNKWRAIGRAVGATKSRLSSDRRRVTKASKDEVESCGWVDGKEIVVFRKEKSTDMWCSCNAPTEIRLMGTSGACRQFVSVHMIVLSPMISLILTSPIPRVVREPQLAVFTGTAPLMSYV